MNFQYTSQYNSSIIRGTDDKNSDRPWNLLNEIINYSENKNTLLDIGCGTASKTILLSQYFKKIIGIDISESMAKAAIKLCQHKNLSNTTIVQGNSNKLPFANNSFDLVTCMLSKWDLKEILRVLKPNGHIIVEHIGCEDKKDFKYIFGKDSLGWRGQFLEFNEKEYIKNFFDLFSAYFNKVFIKNGFWKTTYTKKGILKLLKHTPTIRNYNYYLDKQFIKKALENFKTHQGITLIQNRVLIHATNS